MVDRKRDLKALKNTLRRKAYEARAAQPNKEGLSRSICQTFLDIPEYRTSETIMWYLDCRSEVRTTPAVSGALSGSKRIVIPYCTIDQEGQNKLGLWLLESLDELVNGMWQILEPPKERWGEVGKEMDPDELDLIMVPGVAFDRQCGRLGNGQGYYDRLLSIIRPETTLIGVGFDCQMFEKIPMDCQDIYLDGVITNTSRYRRRRGDR